MSRVAHSRTLRHAGGVFFSTQDCCSSNAFIVKGGVGDGHAPVALRRMPTAVKHLPTSAVPSDLDVIDVRRAAVTSILMIIYRYINLPFVSIRQRHCGARYMLSHESAGFPPSGYFPPCIHLA